MIKRKHRTCSSTSCCSVMQERSVSLSCSTPPTAHSCPRKSSVSWKKFPRARSPVAQNLEMRQRNAGGLLPEKFSCCQANCGCRLRSTNFHGTCSGENLTASTGPGAVGKCSAAERIVDTADSGGDLSDGSSSSAEGILDTRGAGRLGAGGRPKPSEKARLDSEDFHREREKEISRANISNCDFESGFYPKSSAVVAVGCRDSRTAVREACGRREDESITRPCFKKQSCERMCHKMWSLLSFHKQWRICSIIFFVLFTTAVSAHPLNARPGHSQTLILKPLVDPSLFTASHSPAFSSASPDSRNSVQNSARDAQSSGGSVQSNNDGGLRLNALGNGDEKHDGEEEERRILDTDSGTPIDARTGKLGRKTEESEPSETGNEIGGDLELRKERTNGPRHPDEDVRATGSAIGPGVFYGDEVEDFDEAVRRPLTPHEAERVARFNASRLDWTLLTDAVAQLVRDVARRRWSPSNASWHLDNTTSFSEALRHALTDNQLHQLRARDFSRLDFRELESEIASSLPPDAGAQGSAESPSREREGRAFSYRLPRFFSNLGRMLDIETVINEVETSIMTSVSCNACKGGVGLLQHYIDQGNTKEDIVRAASKLCTNFRVETPRVCFGILHLMADEVVYVMQNLVMQPDGICGFLIGDVCGIPPDPYHKWRVLFPPYPKPPIQLIKPPKEDTPTYKVLHLSDTHYDPYYLEGSNAECNEPMCCRATSGVPASDRAKAGKWGDYRKCDTPKRTIVSMYQHIAQAHPDVDYIIWTGDLPPHDIWNQTRDSNLLVLRETVEQLRSFFPGVPVFPALGNHESAPVNSFPPPSIPAQHSVQWLYDDLMVQWLQWLPPHTAPTIQKGGYYSVLLAPGFRIISLNMNFCNNKNWWLLLDSEDPADQLQWLVYELQAAELKGEKVHILGHIPPGYHDCLKVWSRNFYTIVNRYESTITAQFYGHTHYDELEVFYDADNVSRPTSIAYVGPSVTTYADLNPGYRVYFVEKDAREGAHRVVDHETWIMDLDVANLPRNAGSDPHWYRLYSAREAYEMRSLLPVDWDNLVYRMVEDQQLFDTFYRHYWKNSPKREPCDAECKKRLLCDLKSGRSNDRKKTCAVVHERVEAQERSQWRSWLYSGLTLTSLATLFVLL